MRICVLQSSYEDANHRLESLDTTMSDPSLFTNQHTFEHRMIHKSKARQEIDAALAENFDFYLTFMWGLHEDTVAGVEAARYFESFKVPSAGVRSWALERSKLDFYRDARKAGSPRVPGTTNFPLIVKPAYGCASQHVDERSVCKDQAELEIALARLNAKLEPGRVLKRKALGVSGPFDDIVVQQFIRGNEYLCTVIDMNGYPIALDPCRVHFPESLEGGQDRFLTFDVKFHPETRFELLDKAENPILFRRLQEAAIASFNTDPKHGDFMGYDIDARVNPDGEVIVIEVNPMPAAFLPSETGFSDLPILHSLPGGHRTVINIFIANYFLQLQQHSSYAGQITGKVASTYDKFALNYDAVVKKSTMHMENLSQILRIYHFAGSLLDVACGTGLFASILMENQKLPTRIVGIDISEGMLTECRRLGLYEQLVVGSAQDVLPKLGGVRDDQLFDHVVCFGVIHFFSVIDLSLVLARMFQLATASVTLMVDEITDAYNVNLVKLGFAHMTAINHVRELEDLYVEPCGWILVDRWRRIGWVSPHTGDEIYTNVFRFEKKNRQIHDRDVSLTNGDPHSMGPLHRLSSPAYRKALPSLPRYTEKRWPSQKVLVLGLCRTGTTSIKQALKMLGYADVYDTEDIWELDHSNHWSEAIDAKFDRKEHVDFNREPFSQLLKDYDAIADIPAALFAPELVKAFPAAKVFLTTRDVDSWCKSMSQTVALPVYRSLYYRAVGLFDWRFARFDRFCGRYSKVLWDNNFEKNGARLFDSHNESVRRLVAPERLLEFKAMQGWEPLCKFLDRPVPAAPCPVKNSAQEFQDQDRVWIRARYVAFFWDMGLAALPVALVGFAFWFKTKYYEKRL